MNPKVENILIFFLETFPNKVSDIFSKLMRILMWLYFFELTIYWLLNFYFLIMYGISSLGPIATVWFILTALGLTAMYSYLHDVYIGHAHFWKLCLFATVGIYLKMMFSVEGIVALISMSPTLYAMYELGFNSRWHELLCLLKRAGIYNWNKAIIDTERTLPADSDRRIELTLLRFMVTRLKIFPSKPKSKVAI